MFSSATFGNSISVARRLIDGVRSRTRFSGSFFMLCPHYICFFQMLISDCFTNLYFHLPSVGWSSWKQYKWPVIRFYLMFVCGVSEAPAAHPEATPEVQPTDVEAQIDESPSDSSEISLGTVSIRVLQTETESETEIMFRAQRLCFVKKRVMLCFSCLALFSFCSTKSAEMLFYFIIFCIIYICSPYWCWKFTFH